MGYTNHNYILISQGDLNFAIFHADTQQMDFDRVFDIRESQFFFVLGWLNLRIAALSLRQWY
jgi:hypothetical protein